MKRNESESPEIVTLNLLVAICWTIALICAGVILTGKASSSIEVGAFIAGVLVGSTLGITFCGPLFEAKQGAE